MHIVQIHTHKSKINIPKVVTNIVLQKFQKVKCHLWEKWLGKAFRKPFNKMLKDRERAFQEVEMERTQVQKGQFVMARNPPVFLFP